MKSFWWIELKDFMMTQYIIVFAFCLVQIYCL